MSRVGRKITASERGDGTQNASTIGGSVEAVDVIGVAVVIGADCVSVAFHETDVAGTELGADENAGSGVGLAADSVVVPCGISNDIPVGVPDSTVHESSPDIVGMDAPVPNDIDAA